MSSPCRRTPTLGTQLARLMTRSAPTPAPVAVATSFVILFPSCPSFTPGYTSFPVLAYGLAPPAWRYSLHAGGVWLRGNALRQIYANRREIEFLHWFLHPLRPLMSLSSGYLVA